MVKKGTMGFINDDDFLKNGKDVDMANQDDVQTVYAYEKSKLYRQMRDQIFSKQSKVQSLDLSQMI